MEWNLYHELKQHYSILHQNTLLSQLSARSKISALSPATWRLRCRRRLRTISRRIFTADHRPPVTALSVISIWIDTLLDACRIYSFNAGLEIWNGVRLEPFLSFGFGWFNSADKLCFIKLLIFPIVLYLKSLFSSYLVPKLQWYVRCYLYKFYLLVLKYSCNSSSKKKAMINFSFEYKWN